MNQINEQKIVEALSQALEPDSFLIPAGTVLFHGTPIPEKGRKLIRLAYAVTSGLQTSSALHTTTLIKILISKKGPPVQYSSV